MRRGLLYPRPMNTLHLSGGDEPGRSRAEPLLYNVVYCSRATALVDDAAVARIVASSQRRNPANGITGMLVYGSGVFFQWLEGPRDAVTALMLRLRSDARHDHIIQLSEVEEVRERLFPDWGMELVSAEHISSVLQDALDSAPDAQHAQALSTLLAQLESGGLAGLDGA
jgi:hypothetical protein